MNLESHLRGRSPCVYDKHGETCALLKFIAMSHCGPKGPNVQPKVRFIYGNTS